MSLQWSDPVGFLKGATPSIRRAWEALSVTTLGDLILTLPRRYDDFSQFVPIADLQDGQVVTVRAKVTMAKKLPSFRQRFVMIGVKITDGTGTLSLTFFNQPWLLNEFTEGREIVCSGKVTLGRFGKQMSNPLWEPASAETVAAGKIAPVYGLSGSLTQKAYRKLMQQLVEQLQWPEDPLGEDVRKRQELLPWREAILAVHEPTTNEVIEQGRKRLAFDELLTYQLALLSIEHDVEAAGSPAVGFDEGFAKKFVASLPFTPTGDQKRAMWTCVQDMQLEKPMRRLIQGDVGSGKTLVAAFLAAMCHRALASAALLAPTDILATQHAQTLRRLFAPFQIPLILLTRKSKVYFCGQDQEELKPARLEQLIEQGNVVMVGTHAIMVSGRLPKDLALAVVDEQHRFGVEQRETLAAFRRHDGRVPHFLSMTATPIPRSLALTLYGGLDVASLREKPQGRLPIATTVCIGENRELAYVAIREAAVRKERAFIVCPLIDPSDALGVRSVTEEWKRLSRGPLVQLKVGLLHGRLRPQEKEEVMADLLSGALDVIVSTTVIEVGVDVPQATVMVIEGAERFGLAQLHQLRGRVGRSHLPSRCFLLTEAQGDALERLRLLERIHDGLLLAEEDLKLRGTGNLMGTLQSGQWAFQAARLSDLGLIAAAKEEAKRILADDPGLDRAETWKERVRRLQQTAHLE